MRSLLSKLLAIMLSGMIPLTTAVSQAGRGGGRADKISADFDQFISTMHKALYPEKIAPSVAVVVVKDSRVIYLKGFGYADLEAKRPVTPQTVFYIASS